MKSDHIDRRYCPPSANSASVTCPGEHNFVASTSCSNTLLRHGGLLHIAQQGRAAVGRTGVEGVQVVDLLLFLVVFQ